MRKTAFALLAAAVLMAGCGSGKSARTAAGAKVFASADCGGCHALSAAKSSGQTGPNLDQLKPSYDSVVRQVSNGGGGMPSFAGKLSTGQIRDVASFVAASTKNNSAALTAFKPNHVKLSHCHSDYACYKQAFGNIAYYENPEAALAKLSSYMKTNPMVNSGCHQIAHEICDHLATAWDQTSCTGGVFMQNFLPGPMQLAPTKWLSKKDLLYPCDKVSSRDKLYCYLMVTSRVLPVVHYDFRKAATWCRKAETGWVGTCFQSFGRDASGYSVQNPRKIVQLCRLAGSMERECISGGSRDLTSNDAGPRRSIQMCLLAPAVKRSYCFYGIGTILGGFANGSDARKAKCAPVPAAYLRDCYRGARV